MHPASARDHVKLGGRNYKDLLVKDAYNVPEALRRANDVAREERLKPAVRRRSLLPVRKKVRGRRSEGARMCAEGRCAVDGTVAGRSPSPWPGSPLKPILPACFPLHAPHQTPTHPPVLMVPLLMPPPPKAAAVESVAAEPAAPLSLM
ncbi:hypothetical protein HDU96_009300 [Phlyctochytrium bullatum]|nr:hypothetical protein HDU96_009300 [Phlyctochytrium bullatum]